MSGRILVTGATSGIGAQVAQKLDAAGYRVIAHGRGPERLREVKATALWCADFEALTPDEITQALEPLGQIDGVFHGAGSEYLSPLRMTRDDAYRRVMSYVDSTFAILRWAGRKGRLSNGAGIVVMSSVAAHRAELGMAPYSAARAAAEALVRGAAVEFADRQIRVNALAAGAVMTPMHERVVNGLTPAGRLDYMNRHPLGWGNAADVADAAIHLMLSAKWQTGTVQVLDGGYLAG